MVKPAFETLIDVCEKTISPGEHGGHDTPNRQLGKPLYTGKRNWYPDGARRALSTYDRWTGGNIDLNDPGELPPHWDHYAEL